jgi:hypothetical protein
VVLLHAWLIAFVLTLGTELLVAVPLLAPGGSLPRRIAAVSLAQLATHPSVWFIWPLFGWSRPMYLRRSLCAVRGSAHLPPDLRTPRVVPRPGRFCLGQRRVGAGWAVAALSRGS